MKWSYWITLYIRTHCVARGLRPLSIAAYGSALRQFRAWTEVQLGGKAPDEVTAQDVLEYLEHLRRDRGNGSAAVNRAMVILRSFYRAIVAMGHLAPQANPLADFPVIKAAPRKLPVVLSTEEVERLLVGPATNTIVGLRDRAILALLYGTGIRATECATLREGQVDFKGLTISVRGKGGNERTIPLNEQLAAVLRVYVQARGAEPPSAPFFRSRFGRSMSRGAVYERVHSWGARVRLGKVLSPHRLRHTFATHLVRAGIGLVTIRDLLGHRQISSTQIYLHVTAHDLRKAAELHPISKLIGAVERLLPNVRLPFQHAPPLYQRG
jgi:site-specific recombinase XerD